MLRHLIHRSSILLLLGLVCLLGPLTSSAQLEEITVTATKREASLQDVSLSISAIDGATLEDFSISNFYDMDIPGVNIAQGGMNDNAFIRGIGQSSGNFGFENSAPYYIDGVYFGRARGTRLAWLDTERVEVIKGPVPIYLGKNASAGAISIISRRPTEEVEGFVDLTNEFEHNEMAITGAISGPLSDSFRVRLAGKYRDLKDGWMINTVTGIEEPKQEDTLLRLSAEWDITDSFSAYAKVESVDAQWEGRNTQQTDCAPTAVIDPAVEDCIFNETRALWFDPANHSTGLWDRELPAGTNFINDFQYTGAAVVLTWELENAQIVSTTSQYEFENSFFADASHSSFDRAMANFEEDFEQFSQEVRVQSSGDSSVDWLAGVYYDTNDNVNATNNSLPAAMAMVLFRDNDEEAESWAAFAEVGFNLNDQWSATVGGRYTDYEKNNLHNQEVWAGVIPGQPYTDGMLAGAATFTIDNTQSDSKFQPSVTVEWRPGDDSMYYASYKEGFKAGGLDHGPGRSDPDTQRIEAEEVEAIEVGAKWILLDGAMRLNAAVFNADYTNLQVSLYDPLAFAFITGNAGSASTQGLELDAQWAATDNLTISTYLSFLNAEYDDYKGVNCWLNPRQTEAEGCVELLDPDGNPTGAFGQDLSGTPTQFAPDFSGTVNFDYIAPISDRLELFGTLSVFFTDDYLLSPDGDPDLAQDGYSKIDLRLGVGQPDGRWSVALVGRNITNEKVLEFISNTPQTGGTSNFALLKRTRQFAVQARYNFGN